MSVQPHPLEALLTSFGADGRDFEYLAKWFLENDPERQADYRKVWLWDDWPGRWGRDRGIDLIAERHNGDVVAIQAKNYGQEHSITKRDVDTFLSESNRREITSRLLIGTTDRLAKSGRDVMAAQEKPVVTCLLNDLLYSPVSWPSSLNELKAIAVSKKKPRPHQVEALAEIAKWAEAGQPSRARVTMACGTGKSLLGVWAADQLEAETVLVLVPTNQLLRQTATVWTAQAGTPRGLLRVCGDTAPDDETWDRGDELGLDRTTDVSEIAAALGRPEPQLVLCTYHSSPALAAAMEQVPGAVFDLAIADEAHRCSGLEAKSHKTILDEDAIRARRRLFMTATPTIYGPNDRARAASRNVKLASMDDEERFGPEIYRLSLREAIERKLLCDYQVAVIPIDDEEIRAMVEEHALVTTDGDHILDAATLATQVACARAMRRFGCRRMVAFHPRVTDSKRFSASFRLAVDLLNADDRPDGILWAEHVDGANMPHATRADRVREFENADPDAYRLLSNVRLLAEGVNVPGIDAITFVDSRRGQAAIIQAVGRAVRPAPGKEMGTVVLPIVTKEGESFDDALGRSEHRTIVSVLGVLKSHDPDIVRSLDDLRFVDDSRQHPSLPVAGRFVVDAPAEVGEEFAEAVDIALTNALEVFSERRRRRLRQPSIVQPESRLQPEPESDWEFKEGLWMLEQLARNEPVPHVPDEDYVVRGRLAAWWHDLTGRWERDELDRHDKVIVANAVSWLAPELRELPRQRAEMIELTEVELPQQVVTQFGVDGIYRRGPLAGLAEEELRREEILYAVTAIHGALTHAAMPAAEQLRRLHTGLRQLAVALEAANQFPSTVDYLWTGPHVIAGLDAFVHELELARVGESGFETAPAAPSTRNIKAARAAREPAQPLLVDVRALRPYRFPGAAKTAKTRRELEQEIDPDKRLDELGWEIFLLAIARGATSTEAVAQAMDGRWARRTAVKQDFLVRFEHREQQRKAA